MVSTLGKVKDGTDDYTFFATNYRHKAYELKKNDQPPGVRFQLRAPRLSHHRRRHPLPGPHAMGLGAEYREHRQVRHRLGIQRRRRALLLRGHHARLQPHPLRHEGQTCPRAQKLHGRLAQARGHRDVSAGSTDYFRGAGDNDRGYLLYNPTSKMKVTLQSEEVINLLWDVIAARGFEKDTDFHMAAGDVRGPSKPQGHGARERAAHQGSS